MARTESSRAEVRGRQSVGASGARIQKVCRDLSKADKQRGATGCC